MALSKISESAIQNAKNMLGWKTTRKIVVFSVDDYGNVRVDSKKARDKLDEAGLKIYNRFDAFDTLENKEDLEMLFDVLTSVKDKHGSHAVFTPFSVPCNIDFEKVAETGYSEYHYELLPDTFSKLNHLQPGAYDGAWELWKEGVSTGLLVPQFHGREHLNLKVLDEKLKSRDPELRIALENRSYTSISSGSFKTISSMAAFDFWEFEENAQFDLMIEDGLNAFETVFGYRSIQFNPPGGREHPVIHKSLKKYGIKYIDTPLIKNEHQGLGQYKKKFNYTGKKNKHGQVFMVRNVVFEPGEERKLDWISYTMMQIETAFRWNRPAIISSHRVNFCGHIDVHNRRIGLNALQELLKEIIKKWPEVEFMAANDVGDLIISQSN